MMNKFMDETTTVPMPVKVEEPLNVGDTFHDQNGNSLGVVAHRYYNDVQRMWHYTIADNMSYHTGRFRWV